jgi:hypothetical protein
MLVAPLQVEFGAMILCVVADGQNAVAGNRADFSKHLQELPEGFSVEPSSLAVDGDFAATLAS